MKAWLYSATSGGNLRACWTLSDDDKKVDEKAAPDLVEKHAREALVDFEEKQEDVKAKEQLRRTFLALASQSDAWKAVLPNDWETGIQLIVVDYLLPDGNAMFVTFSFPYQQVLDANQLEQLVDRVVSGAGGCCR